MISVIVLNFNGKRYLEPCLSSILLQTCTDYEVIVVDNDSSDGSAEFVQAKFPSVRLIRNRTNLGFAGGTNSGIKVSTGEFIVTLNNDTWVDKDFLKNLVSPTIDDRVGMCASKMLFPDDRINSAGICISRSGAAWDRGMFERDRGQYDQQEEVLGPCAGAALYRREMLEQIGLFDEDFFLYMEDVDLAVRGRLAGWRCVYEPKARAYHHHGGTAGFGSDMAVYYGNRNVVWYAVKDFPARSLLLSLPWIMGRNLAVILYYFMRGQGRIVLKSKLDALRGLPAMLRKRRSIVRKIEDREFERYINTFANIKRP